MNNFGLAKKVAFGFAALTIGGTGIGVGANAYAQHQEDISIARQQREFRAAHDTEFYHAFEASMAQDSPSRTIQPGDYDIADGIRKAVCESTNNDLSVMTKEQVYDKETNVFVENPSGDINGMSREVLGAVLYPSIKATYVAGCGTN